MDTKKMNKIRKTNFNDYIKEFGTDGSFIGQLIATVLDQEKRIIALEKKK